MVLLPNDPFIKRKYGPEKNNKGKIFDYTKNPLFYLRRRDLELEGEEHKITIKGSQAGEDLGGIAD